MDPLKTYDYLMRSRERVMAAVQVLTPEQYHRSFPIGLLSIGSTLTHMMISEWYYMERYAGRAVPPYDQWPIHYETPPTFDVVAATWPQQAQRIRETLAVERDWMRTISYLSFPDDGGRRFQISATALDVITQLALHEVHHRAQLMCMLRLLGDSAVTVQDIDYGELMYQRQPVPERRCL